MTHPYKRTLARCDLVNGRWAATSPPPAGEAQAHPGFDLPVRDAGRAPADTMDRVALLRAKRTPAHPAVRATGNRAAPGGLR